jgi:hypothetical protein
MQELHELIERWQNEKRAWHFEGESGVKNLCRLVRAIGYREQMCYGQFDRDGAYGDLFEFLGDNPGAIEAVIGWVKEQGHEEWIESLHENVEPLEGEEEPEHEADV